MPQTPAQARWYRENQAKCRERARDNATRGSETARILNTSVNVPELFWSKVDQSGGPEACWEWKSGTAGYPQFQPPGDRQIAAHRFSVGLSGTDLSEDDVVLHTCDNPRCVNPAHLQVGTQQENVLDCVTKGRWNSSHRTLTDSAVRELRQRFQRGETSEALAVDFGVSRSTTWRAATKRTYQHV